MTNFKTKITGPSVPYKYSTTFTQIPPANTAFTTLNVQVYDVQATIEGGGREKFMFWLDDVSVLKDLANNSFSEGEVSGYLNFFEYISPTVESSANGGGQSMQLALISMFSVNMLMKMAISSSAALMWSLIHVLQAFRYILLININMPKVIPILSSYLAVVVGDVQGVDDIIPDLFAEYLLKPEDLHSGQVLYPRFPDNGYESPYLTDLYGRKFIFLLITLVLSIPPIYICMRLLKNVKWIGKKFNDAWDGLFWNTPIRATVEVFIEISLGFFLNSINVSNKTLTII